MLESLNIRNFALIEDLVIDFKDRFNVLSGETGAGKSIIIGALGVILGEKASSNMVRTGSDVAVIEGLFNVFSNPGAREFVKQIGIESTADEVLIKRTINADGKSKAFINGSLTNITAIKDLGSLLVDIHGQHEHQSLLKISRHIYFLDTFAMLNNDIKEIEVLVNKLSDIEKKSSALDMDEREKLRRLELNDFTVKEIDAAGLKENEESDLAEEAKLLNNFEKIYSAVERAYESIQSSGALGLLQTASKELESISDIDQKTASLASAAQDITFSLEDLNEELRMYKQGIEFSPGRLEEVNARLAEIQGLKRKYGDTVQEILEYRERCFNENQSINSSENEKSELEAAIINIKQKLKELAFNLSNKRQKAAKDLEKKIMEELTFLGMKKTIFIVDIKFIRDDAGFIEVNGENIKLFENGIDYVEFLISPNPGEQARPLRKIASGGEISRVMLALKTVLTSGNECDTLIFDEVDAGIGGVTASAVGKKLKQVSMNNQILCITHLPHIAALADHHIMVRKTQSGGRTHTEIVPLSYDERLNELARMIGGDMVSQTTLNQAKEMIAGNAR